MHNTFAAHTHLGMHGVGMLADVHKPAQIQAHLRSVPHLNPFAFVAQLGGGGGGEAPDSEAVLLTTIG